MKHNVYFINKIVYIVFAIWTLIICSVGFVLVNENYSYSEELIKKEAQTSVKKNISFRRWVAKQGGVYVLVKKNTKHDKYLTNVADHNIVTRDGKNLTLLSPAFTLSQTMKAYSNNTNRRERLVSSKPLNPENKVDIWEAKALKIAKQTKKPFSENQNIENKEYFRCFQPYITKPLCIKCHPKDYTIGSVNGGISISILTKSFREEAFARSILSIVMLFILYLIGLVVIYYGKIIAEKAVSSKIKDYEQHIYSLVDLIEKRDSYTAGHTSRVAKFSTLIAKEMGYKEDEVYNLHRACMLHDIGKISTPDSILLKPGKLSDSEYKIMQNHVTVSYDLLRKVDLYKDIAEIVRHHHEKYDGTGYPQGLKGSEIPIFSQIMSLADAFDAMTTNRIYKSKKTIEVAIKELNDLSSMQFSPDVVEAASIALKNVKIKSNITQRPKTDIEKERFSFFYKDSVSGAFNQDYLKYVLTHNIEDEDFGVKFLFVISLHNFSNHNKKYGWEHGDNILKKIRKKIQKLNASDFIFRLHGDYFVVLNKDFFEYKEHFQEINKILNGTDITLTCEHYDIEKENIKTLRDAEKLLI